MQMLLPRLQTCLQKDLVLNSLLRKVMDKASEVGLIPLPPLGFLGFFFFAYFKTKRKEEESFKQVPWVM